MPANDRDIQKRLVEQAKQCRTARGAAMLLSVKHWIDGTELWDDPEELHETADRLCGDFSFIASYRDKLGSTGTP